jgi:hypothetical protein
MLKPQEPNLKKRLILEIQSVSSRLLSLKLLIYFDLSFGVAHIILLQYSQWSGKITSLNLNNQHGGSALCASVCKTRQASAAARKINAKGSSGEITFSEPEIMCHIWHLSLLIWRTVKGHSVYVLGEERYYLLFIGH